MHAHAVAATQSLFFEGTIVKFQDFMDEPTFFSFDPPPPPPTNIVLPSALTPPPDAATVNFRTSSTASHALSATTSRPCTRCSSTNRLTSAVAPHATPCIKICTTSPSGHNLTTHVLSSKCHMSHSPQTCSQHCVLVDCSAAHRRGQRLLGCTSGVAQGLPSDARLP